MNKATPLLAQHQALNATIVEFAGWDMPLHYGSQLEEHLQVRRHAGLFDVSHMNIVDVQGVEAKNFLRYLLANDVAKLVQPGKALYSCMLNEQGGVIDDLIVYYLAPDQYRLVLNAGTHDKDIAWLRKQIVPFQAVIEPREDLAILALQGPAAVKILESVFSGSCVEEIDTLKPFHFFVHNTRLVARTGYTGEDGFEIILPADRVVSFWRALLGAGARPIGLGARDSLRLEAGFLLYGQDMNESTTPLESNLAWTIAWHPSGRNFIGRTALAEQQRSGATRSMVGLVLEKGGILRHGQKVYLHGHLLGEITSGGFSPTLNCAVAMARVQGSTAITTCEVEIRGKLLPVKVVKPAFVRQGQRLMP